MYETFSRLFISVFMVAYSALVVAIVAGGLNPRAHWLHQKTGSPTSLLDGGGMEQLQFRFEENRKGVR